MPFEKYLRHYNDLEKGLLVTEVRDGPSIINDLVKRAMGRSQKRENNLLSPPEYAHPLSCLCSLTSPSCYLGEVTQEYVFIYLIRQLVHRLMTWEIIDPTVAHGGQARTQARVCSLLLIYLFIMIYIFFLICLLTSRIESLLQTIQLPFLLIPGPRSDSAPLVVEHQRFEWKSVSILLCFIFLLSFSSFFRVFIVRFFLSLMHEVLRRHHLKV